MSNPLIVPITSSASTIAPAERPRTNPPPPASPALPTSATPNPTLRLDPTLGIVVIEFHRTDGEAGSSFPSQRQLQTYRDVQEAGPSGHSAPTNAGETKKPLTVA